MCELAEKKLTNEERFEMNMHLRKMCMEAAESFYKSGALEYAGANKPSLIRQLDIVERQMDADAEPIKTMDTVNNYLAICRKIVDCFESESRQDREVVNDR